MSNIHKDEKMVPITRELLKTAAAFSILPVSTSDIPVSSPQNLSLAHVAHFEEENHF